VGPYSEKKQIERAGSIQRLLDSNPQMDDYMKSVWKKHAMNIAQNEDEYNNRVRQVYSLLKPKHRGWVTYE